MTKCTKCIYFNLLPSYLQFILKLNKNVTTSHFFLFADKLGDAAPSLFADEIFCELNSRLNPACKLWMCFIVKLQEGRWELLGLYIQFTHCVLFCFFVSFCLQSGRVTDLSVTIKKYVVYHPAWFHCCFLSVDGNERRNNEKHFKISQFSFSRIIT